MNPMGGKIPMVGEIHNLNPVVLLPGIPGQQPGKEQLLVIPMGGQQQQIRLPWGDFIPPLHPVRHLPRSEHPQFIQQRLSSGEAHRHRLGKLPVFQIHIKVEHPLCRYFQHRSGFLIRQIQGSVLPVKNKIEGRNSSSRQTVILAFSSNR